jgi:hypothetical protein
VRQSVVLLCEWVAFGSGERKRAVTTVMHVHHHKTHMSPLRAERYVTLPNSTVGFGITLKNGRKAATRQGKSGFEPSSTNTEVQPQIARETANQEAKKDTFLLLNAHFSYCVFTKNQISLPSRTPEVQIPISLAACRVPTVVAAQRDARRPSPLWRARPH